MIRKHEIPAIWLNDKQPVDTVYPDETEAARRGTQTLIDAGHRKITYVNFHLRWEHQDTPKFNAIRRLNSHYSTEDRPIGYQQTMRQAGLTPVTIDRCWVAPRNREDWRNPWEYARWERVDIAREVLRSTDRPTAVFAASEQSAGPWITAAASLGLTIPQDLSILAITRAEYTAAGITLSVLKQPWRDVGLAGVQMLCDKIKDPDEPMPSQAIRFYQVHGLTVASPPDQRGV
jgi:LacI family transcriptional regulator